MEKGLFSIIIGYRTSEYAFEIIGYISIYPMSSISPKPFLSKSRHLLFYFIFFFFQESFQIFKNEGADFMIIFGMQILYFIIVKIEGIWIAINAIIQHRYLQDCLLVLKTIYI